MKKNTQYFGYCYENDTTVEYVDADHYSMLNVSFTSEDEDAGTDTIHSDPASPAKPMEQMAYEMLQELTEYMDLYEEGRYCDVSRELRMKYDNYMDSTRIAAEKALKKIAKDYRPVEPTKWFLTIEEAGKLMADKMLSGECKAFDFCESDEYEKNEFKNRIDEYDGSGWYGAKRIDGFFDNSPRELIVAVGYNGGGNCAFAYVWEEFTDTSLPAEAITKALCESTGRSSSDIIFVEANKEEQ